MPESNSKVPAELRLSHSWDLAVERMAINATIGVCFCGLASIVIFKKPSARYAFISLGAGWGLGSAWSLNSIDFAKERSARIAADDSKE